MSLGVQLQADVGGLSIQGLGAFTSILATLSADNIAPGALIQMEKLGTTLPVSGKFAESVNGLLQRCSNVRLDHLALAIGWRKNDSASLMAASAGGQAVSLLSMCMASLFKHSDVGEIFARLCSKLCPRSANNASVSQLADVARLLAKKLGALGFGNLLAREVTKIHDVYNELGHVSAPANLLEPLSVEFVIELLEMISQTLCQEGDKICRISGSHGMGHVLGLIQALVPRDTILTVEGVVVQEVEHPKIRCEIWATELGTPTQVCLETSISKTWPFKWLIARQDPGHYSSLYTFRWSKWLADHLRLIFMNHGLKCDRSILEACCNLLVLVPAALCVEATVPRSKLTPKLGPPTMPLISLLGPLPQARMWSICENLFDCSPTKNHLDLQTAFEELREAVQYVACGLACDCTGLSCDWSKGWRFDNARVSAAKKKCHRYHLWKAIGSVLSDGLDSFFIDAGPNTTVRSRIHSPGHSWIITNAIETNRRESVTAENLLIRIFGLIEPQIWGFKTTIIASPESSTIYPSILNSLKLPSQQLVTFSLIEGQIVYEQRYYGRLLAAETRTRPRARSNLSMSGKFTPSHIGTYSENPLLTIREGFDILELQCSVQYAKAETKLDLRQVILGYIGLRWTGMCSHPVNSPMDVDRYAPLATSIASPSAVGRLGVAMTRGNPVAQFLCCENGYQALFQSECCLNCAAEALNMRADAVIIVR